MEIKPISDHYKKIIDDLVEKHGVEVCLSRAYKLNNMNKHLLEHHIADGKEDKAAGVQKTIDTNDTAVNYLKELLKLKQEKEQDDK
jgi:hypothetical protein